MNTLSMHHQVEPRLEKFNGPIIDREYLRHGTHAALLTAIGSVLLVVAVKAVYMIF